MKKDDAMWQAHANPLGKISYSTRKNWYFYCCTLIFLVGHRYKPLRLFSVFIWENIFIWIWTEPYQVQMRELPCKVVEGHPELPLVPHPGGEELLVPARRRSWNVWLFFFALLVLFSHLSDSESHSQDRSLQGPFHSPFPQGLRSLTRWVSPIFVKKE